MPGKTSKEEAEALLKKYHLGRCTPREMEIIDRWYESYSNGEAKIDTDTEKQGQLKEEMLRNIYQEIGKPTQTKGADLEFTPSKRARMVAYGTLWKVAAVLVVSVASGLYFYSTKFGLQPDSGPVETVFGLQETPLNKVVKTSAPVIYLSDGSVVWLKGDSQLEYPERFSGTNREVTLSGEAFFDVAADAKKPFIIHSSNFTTRVLGTSFNIRDYGDGDEHEVLVVKGKVMVSVRDQKQELVLSRNEKAVYFPRENVLTESTADGLPVELINKRKLAFEEVKLSDIIKVVNAEYHTNISLSHKGMDGCIITADLTDMSLDLGLEILSKAINGVYEVVDGSNIVIRGQGCETEEKHEP